MASSDKVFLTGATLAATILSGAAWWLGTGLAPMAWLTWLAPLPLLLIAARLRWQHAALAALCAGACAGLNQWHYLCGVIKLPPVVGVLVAAVPALSFALALLLHRRLRLSGRWLSAVLAFPALWVTLDYLGALRSPHGTFGSLAYSQMDALPVIQLASLTGIWGVVFVVLLAPSALAVALAPGPDRRRRGVVGAAALLLVGATLTFGALRLQEPEHGHLRIGLASLAGPTRPALASAEGQALLQRYLAAIDSLAAQGARAVVLPETAFALEQAAIPALAARAARHNISIDTGAAAPAPDLPHPLRNLALAYTPAAPQPVIYAKQHLIPGLESQYQAGTDYIMLPGTSTGLAICKDMDFQDIGRAYAARGATLLLVPAWDFGVDGWFHSRMAIMRGVESGFAIARAARGGRLTLSDDRGRVVAEAADDAGDALLVGDIPLHASHTLYARWGDWFAWLAMALLAAVLLAQSALKLRPVAAQ